jgi:hypothetical protein
MFFHILGSIAEFPVMWTHLISERTMDGLAAARARGRTGGQKPKLGPRQVQLAQAMYEETREDGKRRFTVAEIAAESPAPPSTATSPSRPADDRDAAGRELGGPVGADQDPGLLSHQFGHPWGMMSVW